MQQSDAIRRVTPPAHSAESSPPWHDLLLFFFITLGLEMSDTKVYEPEIQALLGTASWHDLDDAAWRRVQGLGLNDATSVKSPET